MIYSIMQQRDIPITVQKEIIELDNGFEEMVRYTVSDPKKSREIGYVDLMDTKNGARVMYIKNEQPDLYKHFGQLADRIELEHCLKRGIKKPYIQSIAAMNTYISHFKRGKRFVNEAVNVYLESVVKNLQKGEFVITEFFNSPKMYMPMNLINDMMVKIKEKPLLKGLK